MAVNERIESEEGILLFREKLRIMSVFRHVNGVCFCRFFVFFSGVDLLYACVLLH